MNYAEHKNLIKWAVAVASFVVPVIACSSSSTPVTGGGTDSGTAKTDSGGSPGTDSGTNPGTDSGTNPGMDSSVGSDTGSGAMDSTVPPSDAPPGGFAGMYACTLTGMANVAGMMANLPLDGEMVVTETGTMISATITAEGGLGCTVAFTDKGGGVADINAGQMCTVPVTMPIMTTATLTFVSAPGNDAGPPGTATLANGTITADLPFDVSALGGLATGTGVLTGPCVHM